jgi:hypothetical protein
VFTEGYLALKAGFDRFNHLHLHDNFVATKTTGNGLEGVHSLGQAVGDIPVLRGGAGRNSFALRQRAGFGAKQKIGHRAQR